MDIGVARRGAPLAAPGMFAVSSTIAGFIPPSSSRTGVRFFAAACATIFPTKVLPVKKMKSNESFRSSVFCSLPPATMVTALGSKYFGTRSSSTFVVSGSASLSVRIQVFPAASAASAGRISRSVERSDDKRHAVRLAIDHPLVAGFGQELAPVLRPVSSTLSAGSSGLRSRQPMPLSRRCIPARPS
jgi:hypothetical protein